MASRPEISWFRFYMSQTTQIHVHCFEDSDWLRLPKNPNSGLTLLFCKNSIFFFITFSEQKNLSQFSVENWLDFQASSFTCLLSQC